MRLKKQAHASRGKLRAERSIMCSGKLTGWSRIPVLKEDHYIVKNHALDGDAPKQFIRAYFFERDSVVSRHSPHSWHAYIAKTAAKWYPHESIVEYMINRIGQELGLYMNDIRLVQANGQIRFLSRYFLHKNEKLVHGAEICGAHLNDIAMAEEIAREKNTSRELFTFEFLRDAIRTVYPRDFEKLTIGLVKMIIYDALTGNNDRHFYNWGVIDHTKKSGGALTFAPLYDSSRALFWNLSDENIKNIYDNIDNGGRRIDRYIADASPRISIEENKAANHFELVKFLKAYSETFRVIIFELASEAQEEKIVTMLRREFFPLFIEERSRCIEITIRKRFEKVRTI